MEFSPASTDATTAPVDNTKDLGEPAVSGDTTAPIPGTSEVANSASAPVVPNSTDPIPPITAPVSDSPATTEPTSESSVPVADNAVSPPLSSGTDTSTTPTDTSATTTSTTSTASTSPDVSAPQDHTSDLSDIAPVTSIVTDTISNPAQDAQAALVEPTNTESINTEGIQPVPVVAATTQQPAVGNTPVATPAQESTDANPLPTQSEVVPTATSTDSTVTGTTTDENVTPPSSTTDSPTSDANAAELKADEDQIKANADRLEYLSGVVDSLQAELAGYRAANKSDEANAQDVMASVPVVTRKVKIPLYDLQAGAEGRTPGIKMDVLEQYYAEHMRAAQTGTESRVGKVPDSELGGYPGQQLVTFDKLAMSAAYDPTSDNNPQPVAWVEVEVTGPAANVSGPGNG